jgi:hypothetical protein
MADPVWVRIDSNPDVKVSKASIPVAIAASVGVVDPTDVLAVDHDSSGGLEIGVDTDAVEVVVKLISQYDWVDDTATDPDDGINTENAYAVSGEMSVVAVEGLEVKVMANAAMNYVGDDYTNNTVPVGLGIGCSYELSLTEDLTLIPILGFDLLIPGKDVMEYELGGGVRLKWPGTYDDDVDLKIFGDDVDVFSGLTVGLNVIGVSIPDVEVDPVMNLVVSAYEDSGDDGFAPIIGAGVSFEIANLTSVDDPETPLIVETTTMGLGLVAYASKDKISGYAGMKYLFRAETEGRLVETDPLEDALALQEHLELVAGVEVSDIIPNTSLMIDYKSTELMEVAEETVINEVIQAVDNGILTIAVKIAY